MSVKEEVLAVLKEVKPAKDLENTKDIIEGGYIDSFELLSLISALSDHFGIEIGIDEIIPQNFNSVEDMISMVERLQKRG